MRVLNQLLNYQRNQNQNIVVYSDVIIVSVIKMVKKKKKLKMLKDIKNKDYNKMAALWR